tara:strand:- start:5562 stop:6527 length:966 start_codon:yes stop_codon:yes gene_type:complete
MKKFIKNISTVLSILFNNRLLRRPDFSEKRIFLQGQIFDNINKDKNKIKNLKEVEFSVFSQFGEDGIISWLIKKIPNIPKVFVEIGTQDYWESNTRFLLKAKNWKGYVIEASKKDVTKIKSQRIYWQHDIKAINSFVDKDNINLIIDENIKEKNIGLLSIDIDGNDYWVLEKINKLSPTIIICEFNSIFGDLFRLSVPYKKEFIRNNAHYSNLYFGASIKAFISMLDNKGYTFLGTASSGVNAFFVRKEFESYFSKNIEENKIFPSIARDSLDVNDKLTYKNLLNSLNVINELEVFDFNENRTKKIKDYEKLYSDNWISYF